MAKKDNNRMVTRYTGVYQRESWGKRFNGRPDITYSIDYQHPVTGKRMRKTIGNRSKGITAEYANAVRNSLLAKGQQEKLNGSAPTRPLEAPTLAQAWRIYEQEWLQARNSSSLGADRARFNNHLRVLAHMRLDQISQRDLDGLDAAIRRQGLSPQTSKHTLALLRRIMNRMIIWKLWSGPTPFAGDFKMPKVNNTRQRFLMPYTAKGLLSLVKAINKRAWIFGLISLHCGLRFGEIAALTHGDLDFNARTIHVRDPKGGRDRMAIMTEDVRQALLDWGKPAVGTLMFPTKNGTVLKEPDDDFAEVVEAVELNAGITDRRQRVVFHTLRHTYASWLAMAGYSQHAIAELLGHSSLEMSQRYTHLMPDVKQKSAVSLDELFKNAVHPEPL